MGEDLYSLKLAAEKIRTINTVLEKINEVVTVLASFGDVTGIQTSINTINTKLGMIAENANNYVHPTKHPVSILDGSLSMGKFVKVDAIGATGFDVVTWSDIYGKPFTFTPSSHTHDLSEVTSGTLEAARIAESNVRQFVTALQKAQFSVMESTENKGQANGYAPLDSTGKIPSIYMGQLDVLDVYEASDEATMLSLTSGRGDICVRSDYPDTSSYPTYILKQLPASTLANWVGINSSAGVSAVNGQVGVVNLGTSDISEGANLYFTSPRVVTVVRSLMEAGSNVAISYNEETGKLVIDVDGYTKAEINEALALKADEQAMLEALALKADNDSVLHATSDETKVGILTFNDGLAVSSTDGIHKVTVTNTSDADKTLDINKLRKGSTLVIANTVGDTQNISAGVFTKVLFPTVDRDINSEFANSRFTPKIEGYYRIDAIVRVAASTGILLTIYKNGSVYGYGNIQYNSSEYSLMSNVNRSIYLNGTTDYIEIYISSSSATTLNTLATRESSFSASLIQEI